MIGRARAQLALPLAALLLGCTSAAPDEDPCITSADREAAAYSHLDSGCGCDTATLAAGTWSGDTFTAFTPATRAPVVHGPQGAWHFPIQLLASDMRDLLRLDASLTDVETGIVISSKLELQAILDHKPSCVLASREVRVFMDASRHPDSDGSASPNPVTCRDVTLHLDAVDNAGRKATFETNLYLEPDPADVTAGLAKACTPPAP